MEGDPRTGSIWVRRMGVTLIALVGAVALLTLIGAMADETWGNVWWALAVLVPCVVILVVARRAQLQRRSKREASSPRGALDSPAEVGLRSYVEHARIALAIGTVVFAGFVIAANAVEGRGQALQKNGARVPGQIIATHGYGEHGTVTVRFVWAGRVRAGLVHLDASSPGYDVGEPVVVVVDRSDPNHFTLPGETNQSPVTVFPMIFALVGSAFALVIGSGALVRARRQRAALLGSQWQQYRVRPTTIKRWWTRMPGVVIECGDNRWRRVALAGATRWRISKSGLRSASEIELAGSGRYKVVRQPGSSILMTARLAD